jgi:putative transposase
LAGSPQNILAVSDAVWRATARRARVIAGLAENERCSVEEVDLAAGKLKIGRAMVYRLLARFKQNRDTSSLLPTRPGRKAGVHLLEEAQEGIISNLIQEVYLSKQKPSVAALHRTIGIECFGANLPIPSYKAVRSRVCILDPQEVVRKREGAKAASERFRLLKLAPKVTTPMELVQIDHTLVDIIVVEPLNREPIGRPWITVAIDVATRMVVGFYLSLQTPSASSVAMAVSQAVLPKEQYLSAHDVNGIWPVHGLPRTLHLDNAKEFRSRALLRGCEQHGIRVVHRPPMTPHYGGHIERLIGTLMGEVHLLPGTTFSSVRQRGAYNSVKHAAMTLNELEKWLIWQVVAVYHQRSHSALGCTPLAAWQKRVAEAPYIVRDPSDPSRFHLDFLPFQKRSIGRGGLRMFNVHYWHGALGPYVNDGKKHLVKYNPRDLSRVFLLEQGDSYLEIPYRDLSCAPASLDEVKRGSRLLRAAGQSTEDQHKLFQAIERQRDLIDTAKSSKLKARRALQGRIKTAVEPVKTAIPLPESDADLPAEPFPFEIWRE